MSYLSTATNFGQASNLSDSSDAAETITAVAKLTRTVIEPAADAYAIHARAEINEERIKAGLPPLQRTGHILPPPPPEKENFAIGGIALLVIVFLVLFKS